MKDELKKSILKRTKIKIDKVTFSFEEICTLKQSCERDIGPSFTLTNFIDTLEDIAWGKTLT